MGPLYLRILQALQSAIREGELQPGDQLPPQRAVADILDIDFTTVTRAYALARTRGLIEGAVGRGTFVKAVTPEDEAGVIDLSMNLPPPPEGLSIAAAMRETSRAILDRTDFSALMAYHPHWRFGGPAGGGGGVAGADHRPGRSGTNPDCAGRADGSRRDPIDSGPAGDAVIVEPLTYPGLLALAAHQGLRLVPCAVDQEGLLPESLERACAAGARAVYCTPTHQNPTTATMGLQRRADIARVIRAAGMPLIEDDAYGRLPPQPLPALASLAPGQTYHVATLAKCLSPGLRNRLRRHAPCAGGAPSGRGAPGSVADDLAPHGRGGHRMDPRRDRSGGGGGRARRSHCTTSHGARHPSEGYRASGVAAFVAESTSGTRSR
ncbi:MAG: PLP-dependent aminotransferase family protein [Caulobacteraceae bacterium]